MKLHRTSIKTLRSVLSVALTLWCAGAGCMVVSYAHAAAMNVDDGAKSAKQNFSGASGSVMAHACCKARHSSKQNAPRHTVSRSESKGFQQIALPEAPAPSGAMSCCPLTSGSFLSASLPKSSDSDASALIQKDSLSRVLTNSQPAPHAYPLRLPNQEQTYLHCCVFLI